MNSFILSSEKKYVIYGAGGDCKRFLSNFHGNNCEVLFIIDKRAEALGEIDGLKVYTLFDMPQFDPNNTVFVISIKNVFEHIYIAIDLLEKGVKQIIYKPLPVLYGYRDKEWDSVSEAYEKLLNEASLPIFDVAVSRRDHMMDYRDRLFIGGDNDYVTCRMPLEIIHNYYDDSAFGKRNMAAFYPLVDLYKYLLGCYSEREWDDIKNNYLLYSANWVNQNNIAYTDGLKKSMIHSRISTFNEMQGVAYVDDDFFIRNSVTVEMKKGAQFYLCSSGRNRVAFIAAQGRQYLPVNIARIDFDKWTNDEKKDELILYLEENKIYRLFTKIPHPYFSVFPVEICNYSTMFVMPMISRIYSFIDQMSLAKNDGYYYVEKTEFSKICGKFKVYCDIDDVGTSGRAIASAGFNSYQKFGDDNKLVKLIDELLYINELSNRYIVTEFETDGDVFVTDCKLIRKNSCFYNAKIVYMLIWGNDSSAIKILQDKGYKVNYQLFKTVWKDQEVRGVEFLQL